MGGAEMEICRNVHSGQNFILIDRQCFDKHTMITPLGQVKSLSCNLFAEPEEYEEAYLIQHKMINEAQITKYHDYGNNRHEENEEYIIEMFMNMSSYQKKRAYDLLKAYRHAGGES